jgi:hypothetical protein
MAKHTMIFRSLNDTHNESSGDGYILSLLYDRVFPVIPNILMPFCLACAVQNDSDTLPYVVKTHIHIVVGNINNAVYFVWHFSMELEEYQCGKHISPKHCGC